MVRAGEGGSVMSCGEVCDASEEWGRAGPGALFALYPRQQIKLVLLLKPRAGAARPVPGSTMGGGSFCAVMPVGAYLYRGHAAGGQT